MSSKFILLSNLQVFYYLGELNDSLSYALGAGSLFDVSEDSDYVHTLLGMIWINSIVKCELLYDNSWVLKACLYNHFDHYEMVSTSWFYCLSEFFLFTVERVTLIW